MTEDEWLTSGEPGRLLWYIWSMGGNERKLRLAAVACCRQIWSLLIDQRSRDALEVVERFADGTATMAELDQAWDEAQDVTEQPLESHALDAACAVSFAAS